MLSGGSRMVEWCQPVCTWRSIRDGTHIYYSHFYFRDFSFAAAARTYTVLSSFFAAIYRACLSLSLSSCVRQCVFVCFKCVNWLINIGKLMLRPFRNGTSMESGGKVEK